MEWDFSDCTPAQAKRRREAFDVWLRTRDTHRTANETGVTTRTIKRYRLLDEWDTRTAVFDSQEAERLAESARAEADVHRAAHAKLLGAIGKTVNALLIVTNTDIVNAKRMQDAAAANGETSIQHTKLLRGVDQRIERCVKVAAEVSRVLGHNEDPVPATGDSSSPPDPGPLAGKSLEQIEAMADSDEWNTLFGRTKEVQ